MATSLSFDTLADVFCRGFSPVRGAQEVVMMNSWIGEPLSLLFLGAALVTVASRLRAHGKNRPGAAKPSCPQDRYAIRLERPIVRDQRGVFDPSLCQQYPIEGIGVAWRHRGHLRGMRQGQRQLGEIVGGEKDVERLG